MRKLILLMMLSFLLLSPTFAKQKSKNNDDMLLKCSCIAARTDLHIQLQPTRIKSNGYAYVNGEISGKATTDGNSIKIVLDGATEMFYNVDSALFVYRMPIDSKPWSCYGTCEASNYQELRNGK